MINFFRKIRQQLLSENRIRNYLLYAVGEIFLVMVGILLALQVNNWNEERKRESVKVFYKKALLKDLQKDINQLQIDIDTTLLDLENCIAIGEKIARNEFDFDSIMKIYRQEFNVFIYVSRNFNRNTIEALFATGNIDLFEDTLYDDIMRFNNFQKKVVSAIETELGFYMNYLTQSNLPQIDKVSMIKGENLDKIWKLVDKNEFIIGFNSVLNSKSIVNKNNLENRRDLLEETRALLKVVTALE